MKRYKLVKRETGKVIKDNLILSVAKIYKRVYETINRDEYLYIPDLYEIIEMED